MANGKLGFMDRFGNFWVNHKRKVLGVGAAAAVAGGSYLAYNNFKKPDSTTVDIHDRGEPGEKGTTKEEHDKNKVVHPGSLQKDMPTISLEGEIRCYAENNSRTSLRELRMNPKLNIGDDEVGLAYDNLVLRADAVYRCSVAGRNEWIGHNFKLGEDLHYVTMEAILGDGDNGIYPVRSFDLSKDAAGFKVGDEAGRYGSVRFAVGRLHPGSYRLNVPVFGERVDPKTGEQSPAYFGSGTIAFRVEDLSERRADITPEGQRVIGDRRKAVVGTQADLPLFGGSWTDSNL